MAPVTLWGRRSAFNVQKVLWTLGELSVDFEHRDVGGARGGLDTAQFLAMNPHGRIPVLVDPDVTVWESHSILRYLGARYGDGSLWPETPAARSLVDRWLDWSQTAFQPDFMRLFWGYYRTPESQRDPGAIAVALEACDRHFQRLDAQLASRPFLAGEAFTLADVPVGTSLHRYFGMGLAVPRHRHVEAWRGRLAERPAWQEHVGVRFEELRGSLDF